MIGALHHVEMYVDDLEKSKLFWTWFLKKLGYSIFQQWGQGISYKLNETYLVFVQTEAKYLDSKFHRKTSGLNHLAFHCPSKEIITEIREALNEKACQELYADKFPEAGGKGTYILYFENSDRLKIELVY